MVFLLPVVRGCMRRFYNAEYIVYGDSEKSQSLTEVSVSIPEGLTELNPQPDDHSSRLGFPSLVGCGVQTPGNSSP